MAVVIFLILALVAFLVGAVLALPRLGVGYWPVAVGLGLALWVSASLVQLI